jgi:hypothetical protein
MRRPVGRCVAVGRFLGCDALLTAAALAHCGLLAKSARRCCSCHKPAFASWLATDRIPVRLLPRSISALGCSSLCVPVFLCSDGADATTLLRPRSATPGYGGLLLVLYRVFDLPEELRTRLRAKRAKAAATTAEVVQAATADCLPKLVAALRELGFRADGKTRPARMLRTAKKHKTEHKRLFGAGDEENFHSSWDSLPSPPAPLPKRARGSFSSRPLSAGEGTFCRSGWGGIRTPGGLSPTAVFKTAALDHSATHPKSYKTKSV